MNPDQSASQSCTRGLQRRTEIIRDWCSPSSRLATGRAQLRIPLYRAKQPSEGMTQMSQKSPYRKCFGPDARRCSNLIDRSHQLQRRRKSGRSVRMQRILARRCRSCGRSSHWATLGFAAEFRRGAPGRLAQQFFLRAYQGQSGIFAADRYSILRIRPVGDNGLDSFDRSVTDCTTRERVRAAAVFPFECRRFLVWRGTRNACCDQFAGTGRLRDLLAAIRQEEQERRGQRQNSLSVQRLLLVAYRFMVPVFPRVVHSKLLSGNPRLAVPHRFREHASLSTWQPDLWADV